MKIMLWEQTNIETYAQVLEAYRWCCRNLGPPNERWRYGKDTPGFLESRVISSPEEIEYIEFFDEKDALMFKLIF